MVGIPGRSKGCVTCRRRKKGCDLKRPSCGQCTERGIECGGYDADRIFIYQNHRKNTSSMSTFSINEDQDAISFAQTTPFPQPLPQGEMVLSRSLRITTGNQSPSLSQSVSFYQSESLVRSADSQKRMEAFLQMYVPAGDMRGCNDEGREFVDIIPMLSIKDEALQSVILAIGTAALGQNTGNADLVRQGKALYGKALKETAIALRNPKRAKSDAVLAVPRVMSLFEMIFGAEENSSTQARGFLSHAVGETALVVSRGPQAYSESDAAHMLFVNARYRSLITAARGRKATIFNQEAWKTLPWSGRIKTPNDSLMDIMVGVPELLEAIDNLPSTSMTPRKREKARINIEARCWALHAELETWLVTHSDVVYTVPTAPDSMEPIFFPSLDIACLTVRYWVTGILLYGALDDLIAIPGSSPSTSPLSYPHPRSFARLATRSVSYFFQAKYGVAGATAISFPLGTALLYFGNHIGGNEKYMGLVLKAWGDPNLPNAIKKFLLSMRAATDSENSPLKWKPASPRLKEVR